MRPLAYCVQCKLQWQQWCVLYVMLLRAHLFFSRWATASAHSVPNPALTVADGQRDRLRDVVCAWQQQLPAASGTDPRPDLPTITQCADWAKGSIAQHMRQALGVTGGQPEVRAGSKLTHGQ